MSQTSKFINGGMALLLISSAGCAGNGLRSMFSRNETAGYKTLEELEAERLQQDNAATDDSGPRFASWLPFGSKSQDEASLAAADSKPSEGDSDGDSGTRTSGWWKNPFRRQETVEADPFLSEGESAEAVVARRETSPAVRGASTARRGEAADGKVTKEEKASGSLKNVGHTEERPDPVTKKPQVDPEADDELLAEKFENHFRKNTAEAADSVEQVSELIIAGQEKKPTPKQGTEPGTQPVVKKTTERSPEADDKLLEFERLLAEKKSEASRKSQRTLESAKPKRNPADEWSAFADSGQVAAAGSDQKQREQNTARAKVSSTVSSFDSLLAGEASEPAAGGSATRSRRTEAGSVGGPASVTEEVSVADAEGLFGARSSKSSSSGGEPSDSAGAWSASADRNGVSNWAAAARPSGQKRRELAQKVLSATVDEFAEAFAAARSRDSVPPAVAPDTPDAQSLPGGGVRSAPPILQGTRPGGAIRTVSSGRELPGQLEKPAGLQQDQWFSTASASVPHPGNSGAESGAVGNRASEATLSVPAASRPQDAVKSARLKATGWARLQTRTWLLLLGGIIVVALLFAPSRKKPIEANRLPAQG